MKCSGNQRGEISPPKSLHTKPKKIEFEEVNLASIYHQGPVQ
jgi:hypothetical protein